MNQWNEEDFFANKIWYHATTAGAAKSIIHSGIKAGINKSKALDFGYGFYLCPSFDWAKKYINNQLLMVDEDGIINSRQGYVLQFEVDLRKEKEDVKKLFFSQRSQNFARFVFRNREYYKFCLLTHCVHNFDVVGGPMSDGNQIIDFERYHLHQISKRELLRRLAEPKEDWQLVLHSQRICDRIKLKAAYDLEGDEVDVRTI